MASKTSESKSESSSCNKLLQRKEWKFIEQSYELQKIIGQGSFGEVVRGRDLQIGQIVAIKLIKNAFCSEYNTIRVLREL
jgi:serine/threonine protein kinase